MLNRFISLSLALRYLNPLRTYFSIITLICLIGVALGVMVLIVVLSVMGGLQKEIQDRLLAFSPHLQVNCVTDDTNNRRTVLDWQPLSERLGKLPEIDSAYALVEDTVLIDSGGTQKPSFFRAIDTENHQQLDQLKGLIREGSFDLDMGEKVVVSSQVADAMNLKTGDTLKIHTLRNLEGIPDTYAQMERDLLAKRFPEQFRQLNEFASRGVESGETVSWKADDINQALNIITALENEDSRQIERELLTGMWNMLLEGDESGANPVFEKDTKTAFSTALKQLVSLNRDEEDLKQFRQIKDLILPKELEIIGIYQASQHVVSPELFIPLGIGQELLGYDDDSVQAIALRVKDPYQLATATKTVENALPKLAPPYRWQIETWHHKYKDWFSLMQKESIMMNFVLSFISLISAFCIMAVMFTVSIQRKKELAVIKALGATPGQIIRVFLWQGVIIGIAGAALGVALGLLVLHYRAAIHAFLSSIGFDPFPVGYHGVEIPAQIDSTELLLQSLKAFTMVVVASVVPALFTAYQDPAKSLRSL